ncbi:MAG TPA: type II secretion system protein [Caulobacteraceae bacterium]|nr:type II secretion system protein [Caulobacteraceae bacterium]
MIDEGYTLAEMLVALAVVGLAIGGLTEGMRVTSRLQGQTYQAMASGRTLDRVGFGLEQLIEGRGPFPSERSDLFQGAASGFRVACGKQDPCSAALSSQEDKVILDLEEPDGSHHALVLQGVQSAHFAYAGTRTFGPVWPAAPSSASPAPGASQTLRTISLIGTSADGEDTPLASVRVWLEQTPDCPVGAAAGSCQGHRP